MKSGLLWLEAKAPRRQKTGDRITHRFALTSVDNIDATVEKWLRIAYTLDQ